MIHGIFGETDSEGYTVVGAWGDAQTGTSTTVYKPADFDESNPVYRVKIWDSYGNVTERDVNLNEVNKIPCITRFPDDRLVVLAVLLELATFEI